MLDHANVPQRKCPAAAAAGAGAAAAAAATADVISVNAY
jgi:hypothetical protein